jgi:hypothetical protein
VDGDGDQPHLLAALAGPPSPAHRRWCSARTRCTRSKATAELIHAHGGQFVFPVKQNRRALFDALDALPWKSTPIATSRVDKGHGRITRRSIRGYPHRPTYRSRMSTRSG